MKLYLNDTQRELLKEIMKASEGNATRGKDVELALAFQELYNKIKPTNVAYIMLNRGEAESIIEFCDIVRKSLDKTLTFINEQSEKEDSEKEAERNQVSQFRDELDEVMKQLQDKIRENP